MTTEAERLIRKGFLPEGLSRILPTLWLVCLLFSSCDIEDDAGKPDDSASLGTLIYTAQHGIINNILWSEQGNQIITIGSSITVIDTETKKSKQLNVNNFGGYEVSWVTANTLYYLDYNAATLLEYNVHLSSVDLISGLQNQSLIDSVVQYYDVVPFSSKYFAFNKLNKYDPSNQPYLYLYDLETRIEELITTGNPIAFSPDGQDLLFSKNDPNTFTRRFYSHSAQTKVTTALHIQDPNGYFPVIKWTTEGILHYYMDYSYRLMVFNNTTNTVVGDWESLAFPNHGLISQSGKKMITYKERCADVSSPNNCASSIKQHYYMLDIMNRTEVQTIYGSGLYPLKFVFSPDEKSVVYMLANSIYLIQLTE